MSPSPRLPPIQLLLLLLLPLLLPLTSSCVRLPRSIAARAKRTLRGTWPSSGELGLRSITGHGTPIDDGAEEEEENVGGSLDASEDDSVDANEDANEDGDDDGVDGDDATQRPRAAAGGAFWLVVSTRSTAARAVAL